jgi:TolB-like protein/Tfp pilus assembly protein PilF
VTFFAELGRRNVFRMAGLYLVGAWLLVQVAGTVLPWFNVSAPEGIRRDKEIDPSQSIAPQTAQRMNRLIFAGLVLVLMYFAIDKFVLSPQREAARLAAAKTAIAAKPAQREDKSIAVLPLANDSGDKDQLYFSDGLSDDLINALMQFENLKVIGRASAFHFRDSKESSAAIGAKLGVTYLLTGSVRKLGDTVRINAQLVKAADGSGVWAQSYDRPYTDLFKLQDEITAAVAGALKAKLLQGGSAAIQDDRPPSGNLAAYTAYQQGRFYGLRGNQPDVLKALEYTREAVRLDPDYAAAWLGIAVSQQALASNYLVGADRARAYAQAQAQAAVETALHLNPALPRAHLVQASLMGARDLNVNRSLVEVRRALELGPNDPAAISAYAANLSALGKNEDAIGQARRALALDPLRAASHSSLASMLYSAGRPNEAKTAIDRALELQPDSMNYKSLKAHMEVMRGDFPAALAIAQAMLPGVLRDCAMAAAVQGGADRAAADAALQALIDQHADTAAYQIAEVYAQRRDADNTFKWLDRARDNADTGILRLLRDPYLLRYRNDPRFAAFARKVGLPTTSDAKALP